MSEAQPMNDSAEPAPGGPPEQHRARTPKRWWLRILVGLCIFAAAMVGIRFGLPSDETSLSYVLVLAAALLPFCLLAGTGIVKVVQDFAGNAARSRRFLEEHGRPAPAWIDKQFIKTPGWVIILLGLIFNGGAVVVGLLGLLVCEHRLARRHARQLLIVGGVITAVAVALIAVWVLKSLDLI